MATSSDRARISRRCRDTAKPARPSRDAIGQRDAQLTEARHTQMGATVENIDPERFEAFGQASPPGLRPVRNMVQSAKGARRQPSPRAILIDSAPANAMPTKPTRN